MPDSSSMAISDLVPIIIHNDSELSNNTSSESGSETTSYTVGTEFASD